MQTLTKAVTRCSIPAVLLALFLPALAQADAPNWVLWDWSANIDGTTYNPPALPASVNSSGFDFATGLGSLVFNFDTAGGHWAGVYFSHYFDTGFGDVTDAYASQSGTIPAGVTYLLGPPGGVSPTVFDNFAANALDGSNTVPKYYAPPNACCDVAMAMLQAFTLPSGFNATVTYTVGTSQPTGGFSLQETDHDTGNSIYLSEKFTQTPTGPTVPEPSAIWLLLTTGVGAFYTTRRWRA